MDEINKDILSDSGSPKRRRTIRRKKEELSRGKKILRIALMVFGVAAVCLVMFVGSFALTFFMTGGAPEHTETVTETVTEEAVLEENRRLTQENVLLKDKVDSLQAEVDRYKALPSNSSAGSSGTRATPTPTRTPSTNSGNSGSGSTGGATRTPSSTTPATATPSAGNSTAPSSSAKPSSSPSASQSATPSNSESTPKPSTTPGTNQTTAPPANTSVTPSQPPTVVLD